MNDLKVGNRLRLGFGCVCLLLVITIGIGMRKVAMLNAGMRYIVDNKAPKMETAHFLLGHSDNIAILFSPDED